MHISVNLDHMAANQIPDFDKQGSTEGYRDHSRNS